MTTIGKGKRYTKETARPGGRKKQIPGHKIQKRTMSPKVSAKVNGQGKAR